MKLLQVKIDGFGQLSERQFNFQAPIIVIYGANEAGKSTLFQFIYAIFYGFARRNQTAQLQEPVSGGLHGGSVTFMDEQQKVYEISRHRQHHQGKARIAEASWDERASRWLPKEQFIVIEQASLERTYLSGLNARLFKELCAITLDELQATSLMTEEELSQYLYHASWESGKHITNLEKHLQQEMDIIFRPRGQNQQLNRHYKQLELWYRQRKQAENDIVRYNELIHAIQAAQQRSEQLQEKQYSLDEQLQLVKKAILQRQWWLEEQQANYYMEKLNESVKLPQETRQIWEEESERRRSLQEQVEQYQLQLLSIEQQLSQNAYSEELEAFIPKVEGIVQQWPRIEQLQLEMEGRQEELLRLERHIEDERHRLPILLSAAELQHMNITAEDDRDYDQLKKSYSSCDKRCRAVKDALDQLASSKQLLEQQRSNMNEAAEEKHQAIRTFMIEKRFVSVEKHAFFDAAAVMEAAFRQYEYSLVNPAMQQGQMMSTRKQAKVKERRGPFAQRNYLISTMLILAFIAVVSLVLLLSNIKLLPSSMMITIASSSALTALLLGIMYRAISNGFRAASLQSAGGLADALLEVKLALASLIEAPIQLSAENYYEYKRALLEKVAYIKQLYNELERSEQGQTELTVKLDQTIAELQVREQEQKECMQELAYLDENWKKLLLYKNLPAQLAIDEFEQLAKQLPNIQADYAQAVYIRQLLERYKEQIEQYKEAVAAMQQVKWAKGLQLSELAAVVAAMGDQLQEHYQYKQEKQLLQKEQQQLQRQLEFVQQQLDHCSTAIQSLLERVEASDEQQLIGLLQSRQQYEQWEHKRRMSFVQRTAGQSSKQIAQIELLYEQLDEAELKERQAQLMTELAAIREQQQQKVEERGRLLQEQDSMMQSSAKQQLELDIAQLEATVEVELRQYKKLALGKAIVQLTKQLYEQERQPAVLEAASKYFNIITSEKYNRIIASMDKHSLQLRTRDGSLVASELVSRGTAEQLYLCIRLAIHEEAAEHKQLPLLLDDPLVNFDEQRLKQAILALKTFGYSRQLIYFTCHQHIRQRLVEQFPHASTVEMEQAIVQGH